MARNSEKAVTALARWRNLQLKEQGKLYVEHRPTLATDEKDLRKAEKWRNQVIREIAKKVTQIQNAGLGEFKIRDLNDEINKLLREKGSWEDQILILQGPDYRKLGPKLLDKEGKEAPGSRGYKYFGAAKDLPGVKELFDQDVAPTKKSRAELMREIDAEYYGYLDDEDYLLLKQEELCEKEARKAKIESFKSTKQAEQMDTEELESEDDAMNGICTEDEDEDRESINLKSASRKSRKIKKSNANIPSLKEVEEAILDKKKKELLSKYVSDELLENEAEVKRLAGAVV